MLYDPDPRGKVGGRAVHSSGFKRLELSAALERLERLELNQSGERLERAPVFGLEL